MVHQIDSNEKDWVPLAFEDHADAVDLHLAIICLAVQVQKDLREGIWPLGESSCTALYCNIYETSTWDVLSLGDGEVVLVIAKSSLNNSTEIGSVLHQEISQLS